VRDTWRNAFGPAAISVVNDFFEANKEDFETNESRQMFAKEVVENYAFLYSNTESDNPKVSPTFPSKSFCIWKDYYAQEYKGLFRSQFVIDTLACHFSAIKGAYKVKALRLDNQNPKNAIALAAAAVRFPLLIT
jgi:hypothetical protein